MGKILTYIFHLKSHLTTFWAENEPKSRPFKVKTNTQTLPKQGQNNFEKVLGIDFFEPQMVKWPPKTTRMRKFLTENFDFGDHLSTFRVENTPQSRPFKAETKLKHFLNNSEATLKKSRKRFFLTPKLSKHGCQLGQKFPFLGPFSIYEP